MCITRECHNNIYIYIKTLYLGEIRPFTHAIIMCIDGHFSSLNLLSSIYIRRRGEWSNVYPFTKQTPSRIKQKSTEQRSRNLTANELGSARLAMDDGGGVL